MNQNMRPYSRRKIVLIIGMGVLILLVGSAIASLTYLLPFPEILLEIIYCIVSVSIISVLAFFLMKKLDISLEECRIRKVSFNKKWIIISIALPLFVSLGMLMLPGSYMAKEMSVPSIALAVIISLFSVGLTAGITEEIIFRGLIMHAIEKRWGKTAAVILPSFVFGFIHIIGEDLDFIGSVLVLLAGTGVGIMFSLITLQSNSIWNSVIVHCMWNTVMIGRLINIDTQVYEEAIIDYRLESTLPDLLTGGTFGVEASLFAMMGYFIISLYCIVLIRNKRAK